MWWNDYIGIPFLAHGRDRSGCDCWGLVRLALSERFGITLPTFIGYESPEKKAEVNAAISGGIHLFRRIEPGKEVSGSVVLIKISGIPCHIGIVTQPGHMLHITSGIDATVESYLSPMWANRIEGIYEYAG